jgi:hypothetical protein
MRYHLRCALAVLFSAPRGTCPLAVVDTRPSRHGWWPTSAIPCSLGSSTQPTREQCLAGRVIRRWKSCAANSRAQPIQQSGGLSLKPCRSRPRLVTHIPLGQWYQHSLMRKNLVGMLQAPAPVFWNMEQQ